VGRSIRCLSQSEKLRIGGSIMAILGGDVHQKRDPLDQQNKPARVKFGGSDIFEPGASYKR